MSRYKIVTVKPTEFLDEWVTIVSDDGRQFPPHESNPDYQQYLAWLEEGNEPEEWTDGN